MIKIIDKEFVPYISAEEINRRVQQLGAEIGAFYEERRPLLVSVLNGSFIFTADLVRAINIPVETTFIRVASYDALKSSGNVKDILGLKENVFDRDVLILEDIVDTGTTLAHLMEAFKDLGTKSIQVATLLHKPDQQKRGGVPDFVGFEIPAKFVVGYGLDYEGMGRGLKDIYLLY